MPTISYNGVTAPVVTTSRLTIGEVDAVERAVGMTFKRIGMLERTCTCEHNVASHTAKQPDGSNAIGACSDCSCEQFDPNTPSLVGMALLWISVRRAQPGLSFATFSTTPMDELDVRADDPATETTQESPDPTEPPSAPTLEAGPETTTPA